MPETRPDERGKIQKKKKVTGDENKNGKIIQKRVNGPKNGENVRKLNAAHSVSDGSPERPSCETVRDPYKDELTSLIFSKLI